MSIGAAQGVAVREFPTATGPADYLLYVDRKAIGSIEAKKAGSTLRGVEPQGDRYARGFEEAAKKNGTPAWQHPLPFHYLSTGYETLFASRIDPTVRPREVFAFHQPGTLAEWIKQEPSMRTRLRHLPALDPEGLRKNQIKAITGIERSLAADHQRSLLQNATGAGKTYIAVAESYRLARFAGAKRILFLVDRINLGRQAFDEFRAFVTPDDGRKLSELYGVQLLSSQQIDPAAKIVISTVQRLYSILRGDEEFDPELEERSAFETQAGAPETQMPVSYQPGIPIETFDVVFTDECHRSIYGRWGQVLDYFDAFLIGLTATPSAFTYGYFNGNLVAEYSYEQSVRDGVNVPYDVYRIDTKVTKGGSSVEAGEWVQIREVATGSKELRQLPDELTYDAAKLDRAVVAKDQIRTVIRTFRDRLFTEIFPGRTEVPKTIFFCKSDQHAEDVLQVIREEFERGSDFAQKITYRAEGDSQKLIQNFRTDPTFRIAVTVDQVATGTDIRPVECLVFMRMIGSRMLFEQMKGRGVRRINPDELNAVTPDNRVKDRFVIVDCVGLTDEDRAWVDTKPLDKEPTVPLKNLLQRVAEGIATPELASTVGSRLLRLNLRLDEEQRQELRPALGDRSLQEVAGDLLASVDPVVLTEEATRASGQEEPDEEALSEASQRLAQQALEPLLDGKTREAILEALRRSEQTIDLTTRDEVRFAGWQDGGQAKEAIKSFEEWISDSANRDRYIALAAYFEQPVRRRLCLADIKNLVKAIEAPPLNLTPERLWAAYAQVEKDKVRGEGGRVLTDVVSLVRFALDHDELVPHLDAVRLRFQLWLAEQESSGRKFTEEQLRWLRMAADHIATSMTFERDDFDLEPFVSEGGLVGAHNAFGDELQAVLENLNRALLV
jgi:type I restriction enzyme R subunit